MGSSFFETEYFMLAFCVRLTMNMSAVTIPVLSFLCLLCLVGPSQAQVNSEVAKDVDMNSRKYIAVLFIKNFYYKRLFSLFCLLTIIEFLTNFLLVKPLLMTEIKRNIQSYFRRTHNDLIYEVRK